MDQSGTYVAKEGTSCLAQEDLHLLYVTQYGWQGYSPALWKENKRKKRKSCPVEADISGEVIAVAHNPTLLLVGRARHVPGRSTAEALVTAEGRSFCGVDEQYLGWCSIMPDSGCKHGCRNFGSKKKTQRERVREREREPIPLQLAKKRVRFSRM